MSTGAGDPAVDPAVDPAPSGAVSPLRLRIGVALILLWWIPIWLLAPFISDALSGTSASPAVATVTTAIVVIQTAIGLLGFLVAGAEVKAIVKGRTKRQALKAVWYIFIHGEIATEPTDPGPA